MPREKQPYDRYANGYAKRLDPTLFATAERLAELARARPGIRVLDVATGTGTAARASARRGASVAGIDRSPGMLSIARQLSPELDLRLGDVCALPFADGSFDAVTCGLSLSHFADRDRALAEILRVLRLGGHLVASTWGESSRLPTGVVGQLLDRYGAQAQYDVLDEDTWLRLEEGASVLTHAGFADVRATSESFGGSFAGPEEALAWALAWPLTAARVARLDSVRREQLRREALEGIAGSSLCRRLVFNYYLACKSGPA
ncbi:MAG TPA: methyltransferase domain-containing protein [Nocardioidaceae bacterium]|jgi:SAM-dependent methyltransferase|nr:methyltransferase domain-containing protein [Nocardioidaceae bacterium]